MEKRILLQTLKNSLATTPKSILLMGPRQTGKSTLLGQIEVHYKIDLSDESTYRQHLKDPALIRAQTDALPKASMVLVDEVQRIPSILNTIQSLIDGERKLRFLLTGSSARKLKRGQANLLPGRLFRYELFPLTFWELKDKWDLTKALTIGTLPEIYLNDYGPALLTNYIDSYLREEIQAEALTRHIASYARFLDMAAEASGQIVNYSKLASDSEIPKETIRRYYDILADTLLVHRVSGFANIKGSRKAIQKEQFIFFDVGVRNALLRQHHNVFTPTQLGKLFEQWLITQLIAFNSYHQKNWQIFYYRDDLKQEVDVIVDCGHELLAIEIKYAEKFHSDFLDGLKAFSKVAKKPVRSILLYRGDSKQVRDGVEVWPYQAFLNDLQR
jgi:uncharacterized protein